MDDRTNTIAGWVLAAGIAALGLTVVTGEYFHAERPEKMGYTVEGVEQEAGAESAPAEGPIETYLAKADPAKGADVFKKCGACHTDQKGGPNGIGPQLWDVVGRARATEAGFAYSDALKGKPGAWDWDSLGQWLKSPKEYAPGTKMTFAGLSNPQDRANVIAYLNTQSDAPKPLPTAPAAAPAAAAGTAAAAKPGENTAGEGAKKQPVVTEAQAAANPKGAVGGNAAPSVTGNEAQQKK
ncbi:c-type cytochrome [Sphingomonas sp. PR090111-T3T-6A]|uniref:c-type cytochrome n=1 Tax=Sphingomonas sp. PR090111-T3T-6A TaxID=685778 RepID=UPI00037FB9DB|nr:cytochrome c family protein [Sphingomonas sp. PR090111-T3T-6A]